MKSKFVGIVARDVEVLVLAAVEFGYKGHEAGHNLEYVLRRFEEICAEQMKKSR